MEIDYEAAAQEQIAGADLGKVSKLASEQKRLQDQLEELKLQTQAITEQMNDLKHNRLPEAMQEVGLSELTLDTGAKVTIRPFYSLSIKDKTNKEPAFQWLEAHDGGDIIKVTVSVLFSPSELGEAIALANSIQENGHDVIVDKNVHPQTLKSWLKNNEHLVDIIPSELFSAYVGQVANIK